MEKNIPDKVLELLKKLKALADQGIGGEKINAESMLQNLMRKYNISLEDIGCEDRKKFDFSFEKCLRDLFFQIVRNTVLDYDETYWCFGSSKTKVRIMLTCAEYAEIQAKYSIYSKDYKKQLQEHTEAFDLAYTVKNHLYSKLTKKDEPEDKTELSKESQMKVFRASNILMTIDKKHYYKQLK